MTSGSSSVLVSWKSPNTPNGKITKYTVYRREVVNGAEVKRERENLKTIPIKGRKKTGRYVQYVIE